MCSIMGYCGTSCDLNDFSSALSKTKTRGPDLSRVIEINNGFLGFNRLSIMGLNDNGMQPFVNKGNETLLYEVNDASPAFAKIDDYDIALVCNGEIYGFRSLKEDLIKKGYKFVSDSDCEILPALYKEHGVKMFRMLDAEFALILYDKQSESYVAARDPIGIRPLYYGVSSSGDYVFASEPKNLVDMVDEIKPFPPGYYYKDGEFTCYRDLSKVSEFHSEDMEEIYKNIHDLLVKGVDKRLDSDSPVGFLLSGGLDSSLVCGIAAALLDEPIETWAIGMEEDAIDLKYAKEVADFIGSNHHEIIITKQDVIDALDPVIKALATYDITTIRASIGMYLLCKAIHEQSDNKVILTGEISDEIFGYKYTDFAPSAEEFQKESVKRIKEIHMYDVLRADRCISVNSLEARVPFGDHDFVSYCMSIKPDIKMNTYGKGKYLLRKAFEDDDIIPESILWREKAAFSDAVGHSLKDDLEELALNSYTDEEYEAKRSKYTHATPFTKESLLYREIFEKYYGGQSEMVTDFWMPNRSWEGCDVNDPSARVLSNYGDSGV
ncbi:MAG: asparagine synthase B [Lachnospiraceae bacterium]|nr:asparagine synthase B [Lachnospiraceae bacterium]